MTKALSLTLLTLSAAWAQQATVPLIVEGNAPIVELSFTTPTGAIRKARFVVDTGGGGFLLGSKLMADIGAKPTGPAATEEGDRIQPLATPAAKLGDLDLDLSAVRTFGLVDSPGIGARDDAEGLLPSRLLSKYDVVFDYPARRFTLAKPGTLAPRGVKIPSPISKNFFPRIEARIAGATFGFLLDTGATFTMISRVVLEQWARDNPSWPSATGAAGFANMAGGKMEAGAFMLRIPQLAIGPIAIDGVAAVSRENGTFEKYMSGMMTAPIAGAIAGNVLRDFRVQIDYQHGFTYLERAAATSPETDQTSVGLVLTGNMVVAAVSSRGAPDTRAAIHPGDKLIAVDDIPLAGKSLTAAARALQGNPGDKKRLTLDRAGASLTVTVSVAALLSRSFSEVH